MYLWVGSQSPSEWLRAALGAADYSQVDPNMVCLRVLLHFKDLFPFF